MPTYKVITEPLAQVTLNWKELNLISDSLYRVIDLSDDSYEQGELAPLLRFFQDVIEDID